MPTTGSDDGLLLKASVARHIKPTIEEHIRPTRTESALPADQPVASVREHADQETFRDMHLHMVLRHALLAGQ